MARCDTLALSDIHKGTVKFSPARGYVQLRRRVPEHRIEGSPENRRCPTASYDFADWSGYVVTGDFRAVVGEWTVPTVTPSATNGFTVSYTG